MNTRKLASERVVVSAPLSFSGSAARIWKMTDVDNPGVKVALSFLAVTLIVLVWGFVLTWYLMWGLLLVPYRLIRRGSRKRKVEALRHRERLGQG